MIKDIYRILAANLRFKCHFSHAVEINHEVMTEKLNIKFSTIETVVNAKNREIKNFQQLAEKT